MDKKIIRISCNEHQSTHFPAKKSLSNGNTLNCFAFSVVPVSIWIRNAVFAAVTKDKIIKTKLAWLLTDRRQSDVVDYETVCAL